MKKNNFLLVLLCLINSFLICKAQEKIEYNLCDQDFRPLYIRDGLPANAVYTNKNASPEKRATDLISRMTFEEKLMLTGGWKIMHFPALPRLGLPPVYFSDASQGIHIKSHCVKVEKSTSFPATIALAATWDTELAHDYARSIGEECRAWGISVLLGPGMNMYRNAEGGRNFEYLGEDPYLAAQLSVAYVKGLQQTGTVATIKHFIGNEQEFARHVANVKISERALREIYLPPFEAGIREGKALAVMTGNNLVNGFPGAADQPLTKDVLRKEYGFKGVVMSDWASSSFWQEKQGIELTSGHSLLMDNNEIFATYVRKELIDHPEKKKLMELSLDTMVFYNLYTFFKSGIYDRPYRDPSLLGKFAAHKMIALRTAEEAITLLKNEDNILPVKPSSVKKIVVVGTEDALKVYTGKGSGMVEGYDHIDYFAGLKKVYGDKIFYNTATSDADLSSADLVFYFITKPNGEGFDVDFNLPMIRDTVERYAKLNKNLVVIYSGGSGFAMPWLSLVKGLIFAWLPGQEGGEALANIITGKISPSGKLPFTIEKDFKDSPAKDYNKMSDGKYYWRGGKSDSREVKKLFGDIDMPYKEGIYTGYRWYEKHAIQPQFPFGFGLSYSRFLFEVMSASGKKVTREKPVAITCTIKNTGTVAAAEVVQLYVSPPGDETDRPLKELKGYQRVYLQPGERKKVSMSIDWKCLAYWNEQAHQWMVNKGSYKIETGSSSQDIKKTLTVDY